MRRLARNPGYAAATNRVLRIVQGASHFLLCHDDVAPAPDAVRLLVDECNRTNQGLPLRKWSIGTTLPCCSHSAALSMPRVHSCPPSNRATVIKDSSVPAKYLRPRADVCSCAVTCLRRSKVLIQPWRSGEDIDLSWRGRLSVRALSLHLRRRCATSLRPCARQEIPELHWRVTVTKRTWNAAELTAKFLFRRRHRLRTVLKVRRRRGLIVVLFQQMFLTVAEIAFFLVTARLRCPGSRKFVDVELRAVARDKASKSLAASSRS